MNQYKQPLIEFPKRIYLIGFMGSGKSTIGRLLADSMGYSFVDLDQFIEQRHCKTVSQLFAEHGETYFREVERKSLVEVSLFERVVVSTGGGTPCFFDNIQYMNDQGLTTYLKTSTDSLYERLLKARDKRPLIANKSESELRAYIEDMIEKREPFYSQSRLILPEMQTLSKQKLMEEVIPLYMKWIETAEASNRK